jgi:hypothetical protein
MSRLSRQSSDDYYANATRLRGGGDNETQLLTGQESNDGDSNIPPFRNFASGSVWV